jgi:iron/zinc purple acid phosphatase-like protein C/fibronectin type III domain protein/purple acid phosphatase-like protein/calcineurin-like phosphoesterase family protein
VPLEISNSDRRDDTPALERPLRRDDSRGPQGGGHDVLNPGSGTGLLTRRQLLELAGALGITLTTSRLLLAQPAAADDGDPPDLVVAQGLSDTKVQLAWMAVTGATAYQVFRDGVQIIQQKGTRFDDSALAPQTSHAYAVAAVVNGVTSPPSSEVTTATQAPADASAPTKPGVITVSDITPSGAKLSWAKSTDNVRVAGYRVLRGAAGAPPNELVHVTTTDATTTYTATNLRSGTAYQFGVRALDAENKVSSMRTVTFTTAPSDDTDPPLPPSNGSVRATPFSSSRIDVTWGDASSPDVSGYEVYRDGTLVGKVDLPFRKTFSDLGLTAGQTYIYTIRTVDSAGNISIPSSGRAGTTPASGTLRIARGPYIQWVTPTSARIAWWTNIHSRSVVDYGQGDLASRVTDTTLRLQHMMLIGGLTPGTTYQYRVGNGIVFSATSTFVTAAPSGTTFSFAAVGDYGGGGPGETAVANRIATGPTQFVQTLGDNVYPNSEDPDFAKRYSDFDSRFYKPYAEVIKKQAIWLANGNKEYFGSGAHFRNFWMPNNERWYSYDWGDAHILVLDAEQPFAPGTPQHQFAQADLTASQSALWRIVVFHIPPYSSSVGSGGSSKVRTQLVPLFQQKDVHLVLSGNSHNYERSHPLVDGQPSATGIVYVVSGGGGNGHNTFNGPQPSWSAFRDDVFFQHVQVTVSPGSLLLEAIRGDTGAVFDLTTILPA